MEMPRWRSSSTVSWRTVTVVFRAFVTWMVTTDGVATCNNWLPFIIRMFWK